MTQETQSTLSILISVFGLACFLYTMYVLNARNKHQEKVIADLKTLLEVLDINKIKAIQDWEQESFKRVIDGRIDDLVKSQEENMKKIVEPRVKEMVNQVKETLEGHRLYGHEWATELIPLTFPIILSEPKENRKKLIEEKFPQSKDLLLDFFVKQGEI